MHHLPSKLIKLATLPLILVINSCTPQELDRGIQDPNLIRPSEQISQEPLESQPFYAPDIPLPPIEPNIPLPLTEPNIPPTLTEPNIPLIHYIEHPLQEPCQPLQTQDPCLLPSIPSDPCQPLQTQDPCQLPETTETIQTNQESNYQILSDYLLSTNQAYLEEARQESAYLEESIQEHGLESILSQRNHTTRRVLDLAYENLDIQNLDELNSDFEEIAREYCYNLEQGKFNTPIEFETPEIIQARIIFTRTEFKLYQTLLSQQGNFNSYQELLSAIPSEQLNQLKTNYLNTTRNIWTSINEYAREGVIGWFAEGDIEEFEEFEIAFFTENYFTIPNSLE